MRMGDSGQTRQAAVMWRRVCTWDPVSQIRQPAYSWRQIGRGHVTCYCVIFSLKTEAESFQTQQPYWWRLCGRDEHLTLAVCHLYSSCQQRVYACMRKTEWILDCLLGDLLVRMLASAWQLMFAEAGFYYTFHSLSKASSVASKSFKVS